MNFWLFYDAFKVVFLRSGHLVHDSQFLQWSNLMSVKLYLCNNTRILNRGLGRDLNPRGLDVTYCIFLSSFVYLHLPGRYPPPLTKPLIKQSLNNNTHISKICPNFLWNLPQNGQKNAEKRFAELRKPWLLSEINQN